jgi:hypothetical protein
MAAAAAAVAVVGLVQAHCAALRVRCREAVTLGSSCNAGVGVEEGEGSTRVITPPSPNTEREDSLPVLLLPVAVVGGAGRMSATATKGIVPLLKPLVATVAL